MSATLPAALRLSPLEAAAGIVLGSGPVPVLPDPAPPPLAALESIVLRALDRAPCLVSFSGGRDSSAVLAVAAHLARREGLSAPVPATICFRRANRTEESEWQERVVADLGLDDWVRITVDDELDCVGPLATEALSRHGLLWPPNAHFHVPVLRAAGGGALLTGIGGDEVLGATRWNRAGAVLAGRVRPSARDVLRVGLVLSPPSLRRLALGRRPGVSFPWLRPDAAREVTASLLRDAAAEPFRARRRLLWRLGRRYVAVGIASVGLLAADADVRVAHPLADPAFGAALAALPATRAGATRSEAMESIFGGILPAAIMRRSGKAGFGQAAWGPHSRAFAKSWDGTGLDPALVDANVLRELLPSAEHDGRLLTVLQAAWLASAAGDLDESVDGPV